MLRRIGLGIAFMFVIALASIVFGTSVPVNDPNAGPYVSALSDIAVSTAEAVPCNQKICSGGVCVPNPDPDFPRACSVNHCQTIVCFP